MRFPGNVEIHDPNFLTTKILNLGPKTIFSLAGGEEGLLFFHGRQILTIFLSLDANFM